MALIGHLRRSARDLAYPAALAYYRLHGAKNCPASVLRVLGIADPSYRTDFYTLNKLVEKSAPGGGNYAECGVYRGATLLGVAHRLRVLGAKNWKLIGFDSFEGFPEPAAQDALPDGSFHPNAQKGVFGDTSYESLSAKVADLAFTRDVTLVKGFFESTLHEWNEEEFSVVHLDCDIYQSYVTCLEFFYPRLRPGGFMVFDEYDFSAPVYPGAQKAIDAFFAGKPENVQRLPEAPNPRWFIEKQ